MFVKTKWLLYEILKKRQWRGEFMIKNCVLCDGLKDEFQNIKEQYPELQSNVTLFETKSFKVIPDKFPIAPNHIIILPKEHINTFAEFNDAQGREVGYILDRLENTTKSENFIMFEHGTSKAEELNTPPHIKSIFHAHLHFIPNVKCDTDDMDNFFKQKNVQLLDYDGSSRNISEFETQYSGNRNLVDFIKDNVIYEDSARTSVESYFYLKSSDNTQLFFPERLVTPRIPSQFLREALSEQCETPEWNWKIGMTAEGRQKYGTRIVQMAKLFKQHEHNNILVMAQFKSGYGKK